MVYFRFFLYLFILHLFYLLFQLQSTDEDDLDAELDLLDDIAPTPDIIKNNTMLKENRVVSLQVPIQTHAMEIPA